MSTWHAIGTFNILNQENRRVAAILFPATPPEDRILPVVPKYEFLGEGKVEVIGGEGEREGEREGLPGGEK